MNVTWTLSVTVPEGTEAAADIRGIFKRAHLAIEERPADVPMGVSLHCYLVADEPPGGDAPTRWPTIRLLDEPE